MSNIEFRQAIIPEEIAALVDFDRRVFHAYPADLFPAAEWRCYQSFWMIKDGKIVGCTALRHYPDLLWIASTAIVPELRRQGLGAEFKRWQIDYAKANGFTKIGTLTRQSNKAIIQLNEKFGFKTVRIEHGRYTDPEEPALVMELQLPPPTCPKCGKPLRTPRSKQCRFCGADWH